MTWLFIRFYLCVLIVLFLAWYIHGIVLKRRADADLARVIVEAHGGGARLVASELDAASPDDRQQVLERVRQPFDYTIEIVAMGGLPSSVQRHVRHANDVAYFRSEKGHCVVAALSGGMEVVRLGPFPDYDLSEVEDAIGGWVRLTANKLDASAPSQRPIVLGELERQFDFPVDVADCRDLPPWPAGRIARGENVVFYTRDSEPNKRWYAATSLSDGSQVLRFGPFPSFERIEQKAATTTLALVLLPAALAIALLLRPVARQLRHIELAARTIAAGNLSARVNERRVRSAKSLAQAFKNMAGRTESMVRTQRELLQAVSHELRTPLSRIRFAVDLIGTARDDDERKRRLESLDAAAEELDELVGELLSYVRMETTEPKLDREPIALAEILDALIPKLAALHPGVRFQIAHTIQGDEDIVIADRIGFQRAIGNLLSNAGQYAKSHVKVGADSDAAFVVVDVDDDGSGISESERDRVFEPFVRLEKGSNGHGVGLGLALVKRIVTQHGGTVEVLTSPLGGCRIRTRWPKGEAASEPD